MTRTGLFLSSRTHLRHARYSEYPESQTPNLRLWIFAAAKMTNLVFATLIDRHSPISRLDGEMRERSEGREGLKRICVARFARDPSLSLRDFSPARGEIGVCVKVRWQS